MLESKGLTPVVAVTLITLIGVAGAGTVFIVYQDLTTNEQASESEFLDSQEITLDYRERKRSFGPYLRIVNKGSGESNITVASDYKEVYNGTLGPNEEKSVNLGCLPRDNEQVYLRTNEFEITEETDVSDGYCFEIQNSTVKFDSNSNSYRVWNITAHQNNEEKTPYSNREVNIGLGIDEQTATTDSDGNFSVRSQWDVNYVPQNNIWSHTVSYTSDSNYQPPNKVGVLYEDGTEEFANTQMAYSTTSSNSMDHSFNVRPLEVNSDSMKYRVEMDIEVLEGMADDVNNNPNSKLLYQIPFSSDGNYADVSNLDCFGDSNVSCSVQTVQPQMSSNINGQSLDQDTLPTDSDGDKYIPVDREIQSGQDVLFGYDSYDDVYDKDSGTHHRLSHDKRMIYLPSGGDYEFYRNYTLDSVRNTISNQGGVSDPDPNTSYRSRRRLVPTANGWGARPYLGGYHTARFDLEDSHSPGSPDTQSTETVLFEWDEVKEGREHSIGFNVTLERDPNNDRLFWMPTNLGIFGVFPENGGEPVSTGNRYGTYHTGIARNVEPQKDRPAFQGTIPAQGSDKPMVYKISNRDGDEWTTTTYIMNTADQQIDEVYLLDARGEWIDIKGTVGGGAFPDPGDTFNYNFNIDSSADSVTKVNLRFQTIDWGTNRPDEIGWDYSFDLGLDGSENNYNYNLDGSISCNYRYCNSYRTSNRDTSRPITDLIGGNSAPKDTFNEELNSGTVTIENQGSSGETQGFRRFQFWIWDMEPITSDLENQLVRPDYLRLETEDDEFIKQGYFNEDY